MRKIISLFLCLAVLLPLLTACRSSQQATATPQPGPTQPTATQTISDPWADYNMPTVSENYFELVCDNTDITVYLLSCNTFSLKYLLVSARDLLGQTVTITSNLGGTVVRCITAEEKPVMLPGYVFLGYQGIDWISLEGDADAMNAAIKMAQVGYDSAKIATPKLYAYEISLPLDELGAEPKANENGQWPSNEVIATMQPQRIETLTVTIGDQSKTYTLDNVLILGESISENLDSSGGITVKTLMIGDHPATPSKEGLLEIESIQYKITADVVLQDFVVPGTEVLLCDVKIKTPQGEKISMRWDANSPIEVDEGSEVTLQNVIIKDSTLANTLVANLLRYAVLHYTNNGADYNTKTTITIRMRINPFDIYALKVDGMDLLPYYIDYKNYEED